MTRAPLTTEAPRLFGLPARRGRWALIPLCILTMLCLGTAYSWTIFRTPVQEAFQASAMASLLPFTVLLTVFSVFMPITGFFINRWGSRRLLAVGAVMTGLGYVLSGFASTIGEIVITYGVIAGMGIGITYGVPLAVIARWFPDHKGLAVGCTVLGFGLSPLITAPLASELIHRLNPDGWRGTMMTFGIAFGLLILAIATVLRPAPAGWLPAGLDAAPRARDAGTVGALTLLRAPSLRGLWLCFTISTFVGLAAIGIVGQVAQESLGSTRTEIAANVALFAVFNGLGRPLFGWLVDRFSPRIAAVLAFVLFLIASLIMLGLPQGSVLSFRLAFCLITLAFGGWLAIAPTATLLLFRSGDYARNYGIVFTAYGTGALLGTLAAGRLRDLFASYNQFFALTAALAGFGILVAMCTLKPPSLASRQP